MNKTKKIKEIYKLVESSNKNLDYATASQNLQKIIDLIPTNINKYLRELGEIYEKQDMFKEAAESYIKVLETEKTDIPMIGVLTNQIGMCYYTIKEVKLAVKYFNKVLSIKEIPDVYNNLASCYIELKEYKLADLTLQKSYRLDNKNQKTLELFADVYYYTKQFQKSIEYHNKNTISTDTKFFNLSFCYLGKKEYKKGFELYENRLKFNNLNNKTNKKDRLELPIPMWNGKDICNRLIIVAEQGIGDNMQFYRFIIELSEKYPDMTIAYFCRNEVSQIFKTHRTIEVIQNVIITNYDYMIYLMSLPKILELSEIGPNKIDYIVTNENTMEVWREKIKPLKKMKVGFVYFGLLNSFIEKNIPLEEYQHLCDLDVDLICIHRKSEVEDDLNKIKFRNKITHYEFDEDKPFVDIIHLLHNIDLLITVDTYIVHLAGIMNIKTWLLLGTTDWRWSDDEKKSDWYNSIEFIRKKEGQKFKDIIQTQVKSKLKAYIEEQKKFNDDGITFELSINDSINDSNNNIIKSDVYKQFVLDITNGKFSSLDEVTDMAKKLI
jgi:ADP-heptose:LPS heptosyltransferase